MTTERIRGAEVPVGESLVHDRRLMPRSPVQLGEGLAEDETADDGVKVCGLHDHSGDGWGRIARGPSVHGGQLTPTGAREGRHSGEGARRNPGNRQQPIPELLVEGDPLLGRRIGLRRQSNERRDRIRRLHAAVQGIEGVEGLERQTGARQEGERQAELPHEQRIGPAPCPDRCAHASAFFQPIGSPSTRGVECRRQAEEPRGDQRDGSKNCEQTDVHLQTPVRHIDDRRREFQSDP